jgi:hypothetical protein
MSDKYQVYLGIDPGASGGIAVQSFGEIYCVPMPKTERDVWGVINGYRHESAVAVIERVGGYIQGNATPGSAMFNFGVSYGGLRMALIAAGIRFEDVPPQKWQKALGIAPRKSGKTKMVSSDDDPKVPFLCTELKEVGGESKTVFKNRLKAKAQQLFPEQKVTLATADALLLLEYCTRIYKE